MDVEASEDLLSTCQTDWIFQSSTKPDLLWRITRPALKVQMKSKWLQTANCQPPQLTLTRRENDCNWSLQDLRQPPSADLRETKLCCSPDTGNVRQRQTSRHRGINSPEGTSHTRRMSGLCLVSWRTYYANGSKWWVFLDSGDSGSLPLLNNQQSVTLDWRTEVNERKVKSWCPGWHFITSYCVNQEFIKDSSVSELSVIRGKSFF